MAQKDLAVFMADLRASGASDIRRLPARRDGMVEVRWEDSPAEREAYKADLRAWRPLYALSLAFALLFLVLTVLFG